MNSDKVTTEKRQNIRRLIGWAYALVLVVFMMAISAAFRSDELGRDRPTAGKITEVLPESVEMDAQGWHNYLFDAGELRTHGNVILVRTTHWELIAQADGRDIYESLRGESMFGRTTGDQIHMIDIPDGAEKILIRARSIYSSADQNIMKFVVGERKTVAIHTLMSDAPVLLAGIAIAYIGIYLILDWFFRMKRLASGKYSLYFGVFATILGLWTINESSALTLLVTNRVASNFMAHLLLMSTIYPFMMFVRAFFGLLQDKILTFISAVSVIHMAARLILQLSGLAAMKETLVYTHILIVIAFGYLLYVVLVRAIRKEVSHSVQMAAIGFGILAVGILVTLLIMYLFHANMFLIPALCFMLYCMVMWNGISKENLRQKELAEQAETYKHMAETDTLTGILNRNAYERFSGHLEIRPGTCVATFDLNRLKQTNDELGHAAGDQMIRDAATMICVTFGQHGKCFRIGGDEYCALLENTSETEVLYLMSELHAVEKRMNQDLAQAAAEGRMEEGSYRSIYLAGDYAFYQAGDQSVEDIRARADQNMYADKAASKQGEEIR